MVRRTKPECILTRSFKEDSEDSKWFWTLPSRQCGGTPAGGWAGNTSRRWTGNASPRGCDAPSAKCGRARFAKSSQIANSSESSLAPECALVDQLDHFHSLANGHVHDLTLRFCTRSCGMKLCNVYHLHHDLRHRDIRFCIAIRGPKGRRRQLCHLQCCEHTCLAQQECAGTNGKKRQGQASFHTSL